MDSYLPVLCILLALGSPGDSLSCIECHSVNQNFCTGCPKVCQSNDAACVSGIFKQDSYKLFLRSCGDMSSCNMSGSLLQGSVQLATSCCHSDKCFSPSPNMPAIITNRNGVTCPSCAFSFDTQCNLRQTMECTGNENRCATLEMSGDLLTNRKLLGCATESICTLGDQTFDFNGQKLDLRISCSESQSSLSAEFQWCPFLLALTAALIKLISA
ncbi:phospholipase A2 inhibitor and Ly6/PLAUR domain-containing protein-like [Pelobates fuscus]|uniref:phospholipase A2 inhibitor and Ly6/PLAUR domain-containing protein-like n=1 Tax=Pelobates fuscus TaxID=191477 RepID=UPI002FE436CF